MRRSSGFVPFLAACVLLTLAATLNAVQAETLTATVALSPLNEVPPVTNLTATGGFVVTIEVTRDSAGAITSGKVNFTGTVSFPGAVNIVGLHIHEGAATVNGPVRFDSGISGGSPLNLGTGVGVIQRDAATVDPVILARLIANPAGFYVNLHTSAITSGAMRAQLTKLTESLVNTVTMNTAEEVPAPNGQPGTALTTITINPTRNAQGQLTGGTVTFTLFYDFAAAITFVGLHIHEGATGATGPVRINTGITANNSIVSTTGKGFINIAVSVTDNNGVGVLNRLLANPAGFYVNIHSSLNTPGVIRAQLTSLKSAPAIAQANKYFLPTGNSDATVSLLATGIDLLSSVTINGQPTLALPDLNTGNINVSVPATLLANPGVLQIQVKGSNGNFSLPLSVVVAPQASVNTVAAATIDAAGFGAGVAPESIAATFGTKLASTTVLATTTPLPTALDGSSVYVNGIAAPLFFVSAGQINYQIPEGTAGGPAQVVVVAKDGTISQGTVNVTPTAPGVFTRLANGKGAPSAVASTDNGTTFTIAMSNADGTPVEVSAGNVIVLFGTGLRFKSGDVTATAGGVSATPSFVGVQGLVGVDQVNLTIPAGMAGKGEMDLVLAIDGKNTNAVKIKVK